MSRVKFEGTLVGLDDVEPHVDQPLRLGPRLGRFQECRANTFAAVLLVDHAGVDLPLTLIGSGGGVPDLLARAGDVLG